MLVKHEGLFCSVKGIFYRAVDPQYVEESLAGSIKSGRYSTSKQPTLYLSSSPEGVKAAMIAHTDDRSNRLQLTRVAVEAQRIFDLRDDAARTLAGVDLADATAPWQKIAAEGVRPPSWNVRDCLLNLGAQGLIDPSRKAPGLWHLVLFDWNGEGRPCVRLIEDSLNG